MNKRSSVFVSALAGNILEYYDFTVYSVFSIAIGRAFFPDTSLTNQLILSLSVFSASFLPRPIGGIVFGYIGDRYGRRMSLIISMLGMTIPTFTIGFIPSYNEIGIYAPIILLLMRLIQGLCISGEGAGAAIFILEHYQNLRPGFTAGLVHGSNIAGTFLAALVGIVLNAFYPNTESAWRYAFILGGLMGIIGFYFRLQVSETPIFEMLAKKKRTLKIPFIYVIQSAWRSMLVTFALGAAASSITYLVKTYISVFLLNNLSLSTRDSLYFVSYSSVIMMISMPFSGYLSDRIGKFLMIRIASILTFCLCVPALILLNSYNFSQQVVAVTILALLAGLISGAAYIFIISLFKPEQRFSGVAFSYNLGIALFGGTSPLISTWLVERTGLYFAPGIYIMCLALFFITITIKMDSKIKYFIKASDESFS